VGSDNDLLHDGLLCSRLRQLEDPPVSGVARFPSGAESGKCGNCGLGGWTGAVGLVEARANGVAPSDGPRRGA